MSRDDGIWVGIDVSKDSLDVGALPSGQAWSVPNDEAGVVQLLAEFGPAQPPALGRAGDSDRHGSHRRLPAPGRGRGLGPDPCARVCPPPALLLARP